jgi:hypothetical protein
MSIPKDSKILYFNKTRLVLYILGCAVFVIAGWSLFLNQDSYTGRYENIISVLSPLALLFFSFGFLMYLYLLISNKALIEIVDKKISIFQTYKMKEVLWDEVESVYIWEQNVSHGYGKTQITYVTILNKDGTKTYISTGASGKNVFELYNWIKNSHKSFENTSIVKFN